VSALVAELETIKLGDARLNRRAQRVLGQLGDKPTASIPTACGGWRETRAAYRLFDRAKVTAEQVLAPHTACTIERLREYPRVLCIQDTSELDYTGKTDIEGLGPLNYESRRGLYLHPTLAVTPERLCLGVLAAYRWAREPGSLGQGKDPTRPLEEKESVRWVDGYQQVNELAESLSDTRLTYIADREGDIYDLFVEAPCPESAADWLVRGQYDRALVEGGTLRQRLAEAPVLARISFDQPGGKGRTARPVHQELKVVRVTLNAPRPPRPAAPRRRGHGDPRPRAPSPRRRGASRVAVVDQPGGGDARTGHREAAVVSLPVANWRVRRRAPNPVGASPTEAKRLEPRSLGGTVARKQDGEALRQGTHFGVQQRTRL